MSTLRSFLPLLAIALVTVAAYLPGLNAPGALDDGTVLLSAKIRDERGMRTILSHSARPLTDLTFALQHRAGAGSNLQPYRIFNITLHVASAWLLYLIVLDSLALLGRRDEPTTSWQAMFTAGLWAVHPLCTAAVTYISQRYESLMAFFYLLTLLSVARYALSDRKKLWLAVGIGSCAAGMLSKEVMMTAPLIAFAYDWVFVARNGRASSFRRYALFAGLCAGWALVAITIRLTLKTTDSYEWQGCLPLDYLQIQVFDALPRYVMHSLLPWRLCFDYGIVPVPPANAQGILLVLTGITALFFAFRRSVTGFLIVAYFAILAPTSSILVIPDAIVEHRAYLSLAALCALVTGLFYAAARRFMNSGSRREQLLAAIIPVLSAAFLMHLSLQRNMDFARPERLWADVVNKAPENNRARLNLAAALLGTGRPADVIATSNALLERLREFGTLPASAIPAVVRSENDRRLYMGARHYAHALNYRGVAAGMQGDHARAAADFEAALRLLPTFENARSNLTKARANLQPAP